jgi:hypothetical protein
MFKKRWKWARDLSFCPTAAAIPLQSPRTVALTYGSCSPRLSLRTWRPTWLGAVGPPRAWPGVSEPPGRCSLRRPLSPAVSGARHVREGAGRARARLGEVRRVARETAGWEFWPPSIHAGLSTGPSEPGAFQPPRKPVIVDERRSQAEERRWGEPRWRGARVRGRGIWAREPADSRRSILSSVLRVVFRVGVGIAWDRPEALSSGYVSHILFIPVSVQNSSFSPSSLHPAWKSSGPNSTCFSLKFLAQWYSSQLH